MLSDGRIWQKPLKKSACRACGGVTHADTITDASIRRFYDADYSLGEAPGAADRLRNEAYADFVADFVRSCSARRVLEVGSGSGHVLASLADQLPGTEFVGLEAAAKLSSRDVDRPGVTVRHGFLEDLPRAESPFDFVYAINVIEHAADPRAFLTALGRQLAADGQALVICPAARPANLELLFQDHVSSFTEQAFGHVASAEGFRVVTSIPELPRFPGFQAFLVERAMARERHDEDRSAGQSNRAVEVEAYLQSWKDLDHALMRRIGASRRSRIFGAGEMAALLRCYAPRFWQTVQAIVVDEIAGCRDLGPRVVLAEDLEPDDTPLVLAVHPRFQHVLSDRLSDAGFKTVQFDDRIRR